MSKNGATVREFEKAFAEYVGAKWAVAMVNGTATLHTALVALGVKAGDKVAVPPLTMSATTIAVLQAGAVPVFVDVDERTWLINALAAAVHGVQIPVSLYGLHYPYDHHRPFGGSLTIDDAAQTLRQHDSRHAFTSYSFQASKILALGEGGMLVTNDEALATKAREFSSLGYRMRADQPRIDPDALKSPTFDRHYSLGWNYRLNDLTAAEGLRLLREHEDGVSGRMVDRLKADRIFAAAEYKNAIADAGAPRWLQRQHVPEGWRHDYWTFAVTCDTPERALALSAAVVKHGGEKPYPAWRVTYHEPAFAYLVKPDANPTDGFSQDWSKGGWINGVRKGLCPIAESLQPRLLQFATNNLQSAERNASALRKAIEELSGKVTLDGYQWDDPAMTIGGRCVP